MLRMFTLFATMAVVSFGADDPWKKVQELKGGTEIRVIQRGAKAPVIGKFDELTEDNLLVALKNEQIAIPRDKIDRVDARPSNATRIVKESKVTTTDPAKEHPKPGQPGSASVPGTSSSSGLSIQGKPDFETVYRRAVGAPK